jgi:hypothetical protein
MRGCVVTASYPEVRSDHHHANSLRTAPSLCADMIFGNDSEVKSLTQGRARACLQLETALDPQFGEGSANDAMAIELPNTSWLQRNVAGGDKFKLV